MDVIETDVLITVMSVLQRRTSTITVWRIRSCASGKRAFIFTTNAANAVSILIRQIGITSTVQTNAVWVIAKRILSLPRERQILIARQNIYDGTYEKTPSMGWMFVPLVEYHGGGQAATFEPLCEHLDDYESHLAQNFGSGVIACYRGPRLFDTEQTKAVVKKWVDFYKKYRPILESDLIHVRRPDGRSIDCMFHANAQISPCGLAMLYNPTRTEQRMTLKLPLYYTGLSEIAKIREEEGEPKAYKIDRNYNVEIPIKMEAKSVAISLLNLKHKSALTFQMEIKNERYPIRKSDFGIRNVDLHQSHDSKSKFRSA